VHRLSVAKNDTKTNLQRSPATACWLINTVFAVFTSPYRGLQDSLHRATIFSDQARIPRNCHGSNHFSNQLTSLVTYERARQFAGPRRPIANPIDNRFCFQPTRSQTCVSTLNEMVAPNWKIFCHRGRVDQGQRLNICERTGIAVCQVVYSEFSLTYSVVRSEVQNRMASLPRSNCMQTSTSVHESILFDKPGSSISSGVPD